MSTPSAHATSQYGGTTANLTVRTAIHSYSTNAQDWFSWLNEHLPLAGDVLEVGAGTGTLWTRIEHARRGLRLTLTDFSPAMCARLRAIPGAQVLQCDATKLPFANDSHNTVIANQMLYHLDDPRTALREFARVLRRAAKSRPHSTARTTSPSCGPFARRSAGAAWSEASRTTTSTRRPGRKPGGVLRPRHR